MNRRTFIQSTGAAAAVAATSQLQAVDKKRERANKGLIFKSTNFINATAANDTNNCGRTRFRHVFPLGFKLINHGRRNPADVQFFRF